MEARLILDGAWPGTWNMAADQWLLDACDETGQAALRLYSWDQPTVSLGYFQEHAGRSQHAASTGCALVRRATGGGAIVHHRELTYGLVVPASRNERGEHRPLYGLVHGAIIGCLREFGVTATRFGTRHAPTGNSAQTADPWLCFQRRTAEDLIMSGYKIAGSAQRRGRRALLQHGSVLWAASPHAPELPGIADLTSTHASLAGFAECLVSRIAKSLNFGLSHLPWTEGESRQIGAIEKSKFSTEKWSFRR